MIKRGCLILLWLLILLPTIQANGAMDSISIPSIGVKAEIIEVPMMVSMNSIVSWDLDNLNYRAGHLKGTATIEDHDNMVIVGHVLEIFGELHKVQIGDLILITFDQVEYEYVVTAMPIVPAYDMRVVNPTGIDQLTLITCHDYDPKSGWRSRLIVIADRVSQ